MGKVQRITDFGAFVEIMPGTDGLLHVSEIANHRVKDVRDELKEGQQILVKVINIDPTGKIRLSRKALLQEETGKERPAAGVRAVGPALFGRQARLTWCRACATPRTPSRGPADAGPFDHDCNPTLDRTLPVAAGACLSLRQSSARPGGQDRPRTAPPIHHRRPRFPLLPRPPRGDPGRPRQADDPERGRRLRLHHRRVPRLAARSRRRVDDVRVPGRPPGTFRVLFEHDQRSPPRADARAARRPRS